MDGTFVGSETWVSLIEKPSRSVPFRIIRELTQADIDGLLRVFADGSDAERGIAFDILRTLSRRSQEPPEAPWTDASRAAFVKALGDRARLYYSGALPWAERGGSSIRILWPVLDPQACVQFLLLDQSLAQAPSPVRKEAFETLASVAREHAAARQWLEGVASAGGEVGDSARDALERVGIVTRERLDSWGRLWRENKDPRALEWLYYNSLSYLPVGHPMDQLLRVLGPPDDGEPPDIYYKSGDGHVYVEVYASTGFAGCHRT